MKVIILAAGKGMRMRPLSNKIPKPMLHIHGMPLLEHIINILPTEVKEVIIVVGYRGEVIKKHFKSKFNNKKISYSDISPNLGNWKSFKAAKKHIKPSEKFLLLCADDMHTKQSLKKMLSSKHQAILAFEHPNPKHFGVLVIDQNNSLIDLEEKPENPKTNLVSTGVYFLQADIFKEKDPTPINSEYRITEVIREYLKKHRIEVIKSTGWLPIGNPEALINAHNSKLFEYKK
jgi:bifunctional UDP-N-acetylglucosamine pyrophosphorylase/glucosamine-1-phosphate N-acetyltransferase